MNGTVCFLFLGFAFGAVLDFITALERAAGIKWLAFILDVFVAVLFSLAFGCAMIAYSDGNFRWLYLFYSFVAAVLYALVFHRLLFRLWKTVFSPLKYLNKRGKKAKK